MEKGFAKLPSDRVVTESGFTKDLLSQRVAGLWLGGSLGGSSLVPRPLAAWSLGGCSCGRLVSGIWASCWLASGLSGTWGGWSLAGWSVAGWSYGRLVSELSAADWLVSVF